MIKIHHSIHNRSACRYKSELIQFPMFFTSGEMVVRAPNDADKSKNALQNPKWHCVPVWHRVTCLRNSTRIRVIRLRSVLSRKILIDIKLTLSECTTIFGKKCKQIYLHTQYASPPDFLEKRKEYKNTIWISVAYILILCHTNLHFSFTLAHTDTHTRARSLARQLIQA